MSNKGAYWNAPSSVWNTGLRWAKAGPGPKKQHNMAIIACNISTLTINSKIVKGQELITKGTANPDVPGNTALITALTAVQAELVAANAAVEANKLAAKQLTSTRATVLATWLEKVNMLAAFTESATGGDADKILTTGFDIKSAGSPPQPVLQIENVKVTFTGMPGYSKVVWKRDPNADAYVVQRCADPITEASWVTLATVTEAKYEGNGVTPGLKYWYRVAAVNRLGQGPWSEPALRPVM